MNKFFFKHNLLIWFWQQHYGSNFQLIWPYPQTFFTQSVYILSIFFKRYLFTFRPWKIYVRVLKNYSNVSQLERKIQRVPEKPFIYAASSQFPSWRVLIITDTILSPMINLATFWIYITHDSQLFIKSKKFTGIFNNKLNKRCFLLSNRVEKSWRCILWESLFVWKWEYRCKI